MTVVCRPARMSDLPEIVRISAECGLRGWREEDFAAEIKADSSILLVADGSNRVRGFVHGRIVASADHDGWDAEILNIGVENASRRGSVGWKLLESFHDFCGSREVSSVWLEVRESNVPALELYRKIGFSQTGVRRGFYRDPGEDALIFWRPLSIPKGPTSNDA